MLKKQTKIVATVSDKRCEVDFIRSLFEEGMNIVRLNSAHLNEEGLLKIINNVRAVSNRIGILIDTKGPEIRTTVAHEPVELKAGDVICVQGNPEGVSSREGLFVSYPNLANDMEEGGNILIDDGEVELVVDKKEGDCLRCIVQNDGVIGSRKSVNVPGVRINLPSLTEKDKKNIEFAVKQDLDFIAHSFVRNKQDVLDIQKILDRCGSPIKIIAKIENQEGVDNIDEILEAAYGVMIARGDLGIEVPQEKIPGIQRALIRKCVGAKKPVIVATQMLQSMIQNPRPTRAEVTDIANAIYYRTDALMLSGETAYGKYPVEAVRTMRKVAAEAEKTKIAANDIRVTFSDDDMDVVSFLAKQAVKSSARLGVKAIITDSYTGRTARYIAAFRGKAPVYAICYRERTTRELALSYGVWAVYQPDVKDSRQYFLQALQALLDTNLVEKESLVAYLSGSFGEGGGTSFLELNYVNKILEAADKFVLPNYTDEIAK